MERKPVIGIVIGYETLVGSPNVGSYVESADYVRSVQLAGGIPVLIPVIGEMPAQWIPGIDGLLLPGGGDIAPHLYGQDPIQGMGSTCMERDRFEIELVKACVQAGKPVLGICRGMQLINVAFGGTLIQDIPTQTATRQAHRGCMDTRDEPFHRVFLEKGTRLHEVVGQDSLLTNSYHHQALDRLAAGFRISARSEDGIIEGMESETGDILAVQFHPENFTRRFPLFLCFFRDLCRRAAENAKI